MAETLLKGKKSGTLWERSHLESFTWGKNWKTKIKTWTRTLLCCGFSMLKDKFRPSMFTVPKCRPLYQASPTPSVVTVQVVSHFSITLFLSMNMFPVQEVQLWHDFICSALKWLVFTVRSLLWCSIKNGLLDCCYMRYEMCSCKDNLSILTVSSHLKWAESAIINRTSRWRQRFMINWWKD